MSHKKIFIILGNGFSIDWIKEIQHSTFTELKKRVEQISLSNLFKYGDRVSSPMDKRNSFLSYCTTPTLWELGARPGDNSEISRIIEEVSCCANMYIEYGIDHKLGERFSAGATLPIYLEGYKELIAYLRALFIWYDSLISDSDIKELIKSSSWGWLKLIDKFKEYDSVTVVSYNYDLWFERLLSSLGVDFFYSGIQPERPDAVEIIKPHGSINYIFDPILPDKDSLIRYALDKNIYNTLSDVRIVKDDLNTALDYRGPLITPGGDSTRLMSEGSWANELRRAAEQNAKRLREDDLVIMCGISYWHEDRKELDQLLLSICETSRLIVINPHVSRDFNAALMCSFPKYMNLISSKGIGDRI